MSRTRRIHRREGNFRLRLAVESAGVTLTRPSSTTEDNYNTVPELESSWKQGYSELRGWDSNVINYVSVAAEDEMCQNCSAAHLHACIQILWTPKLILSLSTASFNNFTLIESS
ncbi:hypothetical protein E4T56_gene15884 [Termitomyces sp. T112]|nr:hypothetical protein E4T56_gene15884 [Termitomyces sp. T112]